MKNLLPAFAFQISLLVLTTSCLLCRNETSHNELGNSYEFLINKDSSMLLKQYVQEFIADSSLEDGITKYVVPDNIVEDLKRMRDQPETQLVCLSIYFLKIYQGHLICCNQGYELRNHIDFSSGEIDSVYDPFLYEFNRITKVFAENQNIDFINSDIAYDYVSRNRHLLKNKEIEFEFRRITNKINTYR
jgi:hypothetical protein